MYVHFTLVAHEVSSGFTDEHNFILYFIFILLWMFTIGYNCIGHFLSLFKQQIENNKKTYFYIIQYLPKSTVECICMISFPNNKHFL